MKWVHGPPTSPGFWLTFFPGHPDRILNVQDMGGSLMAWIPRSVALDDKEAKGECFVPVVEFLGDVSCRLLEVPDTLPEDVF